MAWGAEQYNDNRFYINPDASILSNMLSITEQHLIRKLICGFDLQTMTDQFLSEGRIDEELLYPFEDVTWETVFGDLKCAEFYDVQFDKESSRDINKYLNFVQYIHDTDTAQLRDSPMYDIKQLSGMIMGEVWIGIKERFVDILTDTDRDRSNLTQAVCEALVEELRVAIAKYSERLQDINPESENGFLSILDGMRDIYTDLIYDEDTLVKTTYASIVKGAEVLICNPEYLPFGERLNSAMKYFIAGGSLVVGNKVMEIFEKTGVDIKGILGDEIVVFLPSLISCSISCICIVEIDHNQILQRLTAEFNKIPTVTYEIRQLRESAEQFEHMAAKLAEIDYEALKKEIDGYSILAEDLDRISSPEDLNRYLMSYYEKTGKELPWGNRSIEEHWADPTSRLVFK